jgi:hypothetical protein
VPESHRFRTAYRGILIFFLVYRLNETRLLAASQTYFDGIGKSEYLRAKARRLATQRSEWRTEPLRHETAVQADNLRRILNRRHFRDHLDAVLSNGA